MADSLTDEAQRDAPTFLFGDAVRGRTDLETVVDGNAVLRRHNTVIRANRVEYYAPDDRVKATGQVRVSRNGSIFEGTVLDLRINAFEGSLLSPTYQFTRNATHGAAERIDMVDDKRVVIKNAWLTSCRKEPGPGWLPDWVLTASQIKMDTETDEGDATNAVVRFKNTPIFGVPRLNFPLSDARRSGFLPPSFNLDNVSGFEFTQPYYLNIAPNRDATFEPTVKLRRGIDVGAEYRYLEREYNGTVRASVMPYDRLRERSRWGFSAVHSGDVSLSAAGDWRFGLDASRVSDDNYWRDFPRSGNALTQRLLPVSLSLAKSVGPVCVVARSLIWQTLQDAGSPITPPYDRLPQITAQYSKAATNTGAFSGWDVAAEADYTRFQSDPKLTAQVNATRAFARAELVRPFSAPGWFVNPKLQIHTTSYQFDAPLASGATTAGRTLPTLSLDGGLIFERNTQFFGRSLQQTLEPRAFYVRTPYRDQSALPNYDSGANDFNFATVFTENNFGGNDRIADANLLTLGLTSRFLVPDTGAEALRFGVAQRLRFDDQRVTLPGGTVVQDRVSDLLVGATANWSSTWSADTTIQYNQKARQSERATISGRYSPSNYRVVNAAYRLQRGSSEQLDMSWQWPLDDLWRGKRVMSESPLGQGRWYSVGRLNYSVTDRRFVDAVLGLEYDGDCWLARAVVERLQRGSPNLSGGPESNKRILFQLEFVGFSRLGNNPLAALQRNIPRYQLLRQQTSTPSRFSNYE